MKKDFQNIGIVSYWFNRGQATVGRYIRSILDDLGYNTFVLARPTKSRFAKPAFIAENDVWSQYGITKASQFEIPTDEFIRWAKNNNLQIVFFDQNYQFDAIKKLKNFGIVTVGRFVWESFSETHVDDALKSFDVIYSLTKCERDRYREFGIESPLLRWGVHCELLPFRKRNKSKFITFFYPGGYLSPRKPLGVLLEAFSRVKSDRIRLIIKIQKKHQTRDLAIAQSIEHTYKSKIDNDDPILLQRSRLLDDPRISVITDDLTTDSYYELFASCHVCLAPSRWEGLGLHLFEALAFGMPIITNNIPPMNEIVLNQKNGILIKSHLIGKTKSGIQAFEPDIDDLASSIEFLSNPQNVIELEKGVCDSCARFPWQHTISDYSQLIQNYLKTSA